MSDFNDCSTLTGYGELTFVVITSIWSTDRSRYIGKFSRILLELLSNGATSPSYIIQNDVPDAETMKTSKGK